METTSWVVNPNQSEISNDAQTRQWNLSKPVVGETSPGDQDLQFHYSVFMALYEHFIRVLLSIITLFSDKQI